MATTTLEMYRKIGFAIAMTLGVPFGGVSRFSTDPTKAVLTFQGIPYDKGQIGCIFCLLPMTWLTPLPNGDIRVRPFQQGEFKIYVGELAAHKAFRHCNIFPAGSPCWGGVNRSANITELALWMVETVLRTNVTDKAAADRASNSMGTSNSEIMRTKAALQKEARKTLPSAFSLDTVGLRKKFAHYFGG